MAAFDVSVIGELNLDLILYGLPPALIPECEHLASGLTITLGSSSAIFAHNLASLGSKVGFSSCVGGDPFGEVCLQRLGASGVDLSRMRRMPGKTTGLTVILPREKQRYILTYPGSMYDLAECDLDMDYVLNARHLHVSSYFLLKGMQPSLPQIFCKAKDAGLSTSLDTNDDPEDRWAADIDALLQYTDVLLPNEREACKLAKADDVERAAEILSQRVRIVVIKCGANGVLARSESDRFTATPPSVECFDPVGAGDSFDAGFLHEFVRGANVEQCLHSGNVAGALSVTRPGGTEAFRDAAHRDAFLCEHRSRA